MLGASFPVLGYVAPLCRPEQAPRRHPARQWLCVCVRRPAKAGAGDPIRTTGLEPLGRVRRGGAARDARPNGSQRIIGGINSRCPGASLSGSSMPLAWAIRRHSAGSSYSRLEIPCSVSPRPTR